VQEALEGLCRVRGRAAAAVTNEKTVRRRFARCGDASPPTVAPRDASPRRRPPRELGRAADRSSRELASRELGRFFVSHVFSFSTPSVFFAALNLQLGKKKKKHPAQAASQPAMSAMRARALSLSARLEARLSGAHTRPGHGAVPCARRECRCAARGRPRRQEGPLPGAPAAARAQREHVVCGVAALGPPRGARGAPSCSSGPGATPPRRLRSPPGRGERRPWRLAPRRRSSRLGAAPESRARGPKRVLLFGL
jgi:hypothetical protein